MGDRSSGIQISELRYTWGLPSRCDTVAPHSDFVEWKREGGRDSGRREGGKGKRENGNRHREERGREKGWWDTGCPHGGREAAGHRGQRQLPSPSLSYLLIGPAALSVSSEEASKMKKLP